MIRNTLQRFFYGRYGNDQLNTALLALYLVLFLLCQMTRLDILYYLSLLALGGLVFRMLSRNLVRRRAENDLFLQMIEPLRNWYRLRRTIHRDKEHCYFRCPNCGQHLRVPRGKGKIQVTCRGCGATFEEKS